MQELLTSPGSLLSVFMQIFKQVEGHLKPRAFNSKPLLL